MYPFKVGHSCMYIIMTTTETQNPFLSPQRSSLKGELGEGDLEQTLISTEHHMVLLNHCIIHPKLREHCMLTIPELKQKASSLKHFCSSIPSTDPGNYRSAI